MSDDDNVLMEGIMSDAVTRARRAFDKVAALPTVTLRPVGGPEWTEARFGLGPFPARLQLDGTDVVARAIVELGPVTDPVGVEEAMHTIPYPSPLVMVPLVPGEPLSLEYDLPLSDVTRHEALAILGACAMYTVALVDRLYPILSTVTQRSLQEAGYRPGEGLPADPRTWLAAEPVTNRAWDDAEAASEIKECNELLRSAGGMLITAGVGLGVEAGLPDFRTDQGLWQAYPALRRAGMTFTTIANPRAFVDDPRLAWGFYGSRLNRCRSAEPGRAHKLLSLIADEMPEGTFVCTTAVDGLFEKAGFDPERIVELHGSIHRLQCQKPCSSAIWPTDDFVPEVDEASCRLTGPLPTCPRCGGPARPNVLMFGEDRAWIPNRRDQRSAALESWRSSLDRLLVLELDVNPGSSLRRTGEWLASDLIRVNPDPEGAANDHGISLVMTATSALEGIENDRPRATPSERPLAEYLRLQAEIRAIDQWADFSEDYRYGEPVDPEAANSGPDRSILLARMRELEQHDAEVARVCALMRERERLLQLILEVAGEGGGATLYGWKDAKGAWHLQTDPDDLTDFLPEDLVPAERRSDVGWPEALNLLPSAWPELYPLHVHPEFAQQIMDERRLTQRCGRAASNADEAWEDACSSGRIASLRRRTDDEDDTRAGGVLVDVALAAGWHTQAAELLVSQDRPAEALEILWPMAERGDDRAIAKLVEILMAKGQAAAPDEVRAASRLLIDRARVEDGLRLLIEAGLIDDAIDELQALADAADTVGRKALIDLVHRAGWSDLIEAVSNGDTGTAGSNVFDPYAHVEADYEAVWSWGRRELMRRLRRWDHALGGPWTEAHEDAPLGRLAWATYLTLWRNGLAGSLTEPRTAKQWRVFAEAAVAGWLFYPVDDPHDLFGVTDVLMPIDTLDDLARRTRRFAEDRQWEAFHTPKNLAMALGAEVGRLAEALKWLTDTEIQGALETGDLRKQLATEMADILIYLTRLADVTGIDLLEASEARMIRNEARYPAVVIDDRP